MNAHVQVPALQRRIPDVVAEYDAKVAAIDTALKSFETAGDALKTAACVGGEYGDVTIDVGHVHVDTLKKSLLKSAWKHIYTGLNIDRIASADDKRKWKHALENPAPFTLDNIRATLGHYHQNPRQNILRGLAEVFCQLDQSYKSHDKVKIGVAGLPKRIILTNVCGWGSYGRDKLRDMFNALANYQGRPLIDHKEFDELDSLHSALRKRSGEVTIRGLRVKKFENGNGHVMFDRHTLRDINMALAEFYGDVLPDTTDEKPTQRAASTAVAKDLQYYPTPEKLADDIIGHALGDDLRRKRVLEPSCGDGRLMQALRRRGADVFGIEVDASRVALARMAGFRVLPANFLEVSPASIGGAEYDIVCMNPPFYGLHYAKHVRHAFKFLKPGGILIAILPVTSREHGELDDLIGNVRYREPWRDLPVGSFSESGTNVNTTVLTLYKPKEAA